jgi:hypothetical protein
MDWMVGGLALACIKVDYYTLDQNTIPKSYFLQATCLHVFNVLLRQMICPTHPTELDPSLGPPARQRAPASGPIRARDSSTHRANPQHLNSAPLPDLFIKFGRRDITCMFQPPHVHEIVIYRFTRGRYDTGKSSIGRVYCTGR